MTPSVIEQAISAHRAGQLDDAERLYRSVLDAQPANPDALALLGVVLEAKGRVDEALAVLDRALACDPNAALFHFYQANALTAAGDLAKAESAYRSALRLDPHIAQAHYNLGNLLRAQDRPDEAKQCYADAIALRPTYAEARNNFALMEEKEKHFDAAVHELIQVVRDAPTFFDGWMNLCRVAERAGAYDISFQAGKQAIALNPESPSAYLGLAVALNCLEKHEAALTAYERALKLKPDWVEAWDNIGQTYQFTNRLDEAEIAYRKTIELAGQAIEGEGQRTVAENEYGDRHWHLALLELLQGKLQSGFARYKARFAATDIKRPQVQTPLWQGQPLSGKTIVIYDEQGMGDTIMLARYLPLLKVRGARVVFLVQAALVPLFEGWSGLDVVTTRERFLGSSDFYASTFDLPALFETTLDTIPADAPYLPHATPDDGRLLAGDGKHLRLGVVWAGAPKHKHDGRRSLPLRLFSRLFADQNIQFYSLNRDVRPGDAEMLSRFQNVTDLAPRLRHFGDLACFMSQMDLIITCDTATAHLAGAMGLPVWTLLPFAPDWRWLLDREDCVWYPTMRLFRQLTAGDWTNVIARVQSALHQNYAKNSN